MPKIFLIKNRLEQQQLRLSQGYKGDSNESLTPPGSPLSDVAPLALIVRSQTEGEYHPLTVFIYCYFYVFLFLVNKIRKDCAAVRHCWLPPGIRAKSSLFIICLRDSSGSVVSVLPKTPLSAEDERREWHYIELITLVITSERSSSLSLSRAIVRWKMLEFDFNIGPE